MILTLNSNLNRNTVTVRSKQPTVAKFLSTAEEAHIQLESSSTHLNSNILSITNSAASKEIFLSTNERLVSFNDSNIIIGSQTTVQGHLSYQHPYDLGSSNNRWRHLELTGDTIQINNALLKFTTDHCSTETSFLNTNDLQSYTSLHVKEMHIQYPDDYYSILSTGPTGALITAYNPDGSVINSVNLGIATTADIPETTNLYYTRQRVLDVLSTLNINSPTVYIEETSNILIHFFSSNVNAIATILDGRSSNIYSNIEQSSNNLFSNLQVYNKISSNYLETTSNQLTSNIKATSNNLMQIPPTIISSTSNYISKKSITLSDSISATSNNIFKDIVKTSNFSFKYYINTSNYLQSNIIRTSNATILSIKAIDKLASNQVFDLTSNILKTNISISCNITSNIKQLAENQSNYVSDISKQLHSNILHMSIDIYGQLHQSTLITSNYITESYTSLSNVLFISSNALSDHITQLTTDQVQEGTHNKYIVNDVYNNDLTVSNLTVINHLVPSADGVYSLGSPTNKWKELYVSGNTIYLDNVSLSSDPVEDTLVFSTATDDQNTQTPIPIITRSVKLLDTQTGETTIMQSVNNQIVIGTYDPENPNKNYVKKLTTNDIPETAGGSNYYFKPTNVIAMSDASNAIVFTYASNLLDSQLNQKLDTLATNIIPIGSSNQLIVNKEYNSNLLIIGTLTTSNLDVIGTNSFIKTDVFKTTNLEILTNRSAAALTIYQRGNQNVAEFNSNIVIRNNGVVVLADSELLATAALNIEGNIRFSGNIFSVSSNQLSFLQGTASNIQKQIDDAHIYGSNYVNNISNIVASDLNSTSNNISSTITSIDQRQSNVLDDISKWMSRLFNAASNTLSSNVVKLDNDTSNNIISPTFQTYSSNVTTVNSNIDARIITLDANISNFVAVTSNNIRNTLSNTSNSINSLVSGILGNRWQQAANSIYFQNYVGVGTNDPKTNLDIVGNIKFTGRINNVTSNQLRFLEGLNAPLQTQINNISIISSNNTSNTFSQLTSNWSTLTNTLSSNISGFDIITSNLISSTFNILSSNVTAMSDSLNARINSLNFSPWKTTTNGIYFMNSVGIGTAVINSSNRLEIFGGDLMLNGTGCNIEKTYLDKPEIYPILTQKELSPIIWYQFNSLILPSYILSDSNSNALKFNATISTDLDPFFYDTTNLMLWHKFDNNSSNMLLDSSGNNYHLSLPGGSSNATFDNTNMKVGDGSIAFSDPKYAILNSAIDLYNISKDVGISFSLWFYVNRSATSANQDLFYFANGELSAGVLNIFNASNNLLNVRIYYDASFSMFALYFYLKNNSAFSVQPSFHYMEDLKWHHLAFSVSKTGEWNIYINTNKVYYLQSGTSYVIANASYLYKKIGYSGTGDKSFNGNIDDFRIYNKILSQNEITALYFGNSNIINTTKTATYNDVANQNLVSWYKFDNSNIILDSSGNNPPRNLTNVGEFQIETSDYIRGDQCVKFLGTNYFATSNINGVFSPNNFTIAFWCKRPYSSSYATIASCVQANDGTLSNGWYIDSIENRMIFNTRNNGADDSGISYYYKDNIIEANFNGGYYNQSVTYWRHIAITLSKPQTGNAIVNYFIDGIKFKSGTRSYNNNLSGTFRLGTIWVSSSTPQRPLPNGSLLDDFRFYNRVLTDNEILDIVGANTTIKRTTGYTNNYIYQNAYLWYGNTNATNDNYYLANYSSGNIQSFLNSFHITGGFNIHFVFSTSNLTSKSELLYIGNNYAAPGVSTTIIRTYIENANLNFQVGANMISSSINVNTYYVTDLTCSITGNPKNITLSTSLYDGNTKYVTSSAPNIYNDILLNTNVSTSNLVLWIGKHPDNTNDATPITLQDFRIFASVLPSEAITALQSGGTTYLTTSNLYTYVRNYQIQRWQDSPTYYDLTFGSKYITFNQGNVGIATTNPASLLHIGSGTYSTQQTMRYFTYNATPALTSASTTLADTCSIFDSSILVKNVIASSSDSRIKKNIKDIDDDSALQKIMSIEPKTYNYIDPVRGKDKVYGFIAQQIKDVIPEAIKMQNSIIPNIFCTADCFLNVVTFPSSIAKYNLDTNSRISIINQNGEQYTYNITMVNLETNAITLDRNISTDKVFVYGTEVQDFHSLDKSYIYSLNVCATQRLSQKVDNILGRLSYLEYIKNNR